jgi:hypothetical protein
MSARMGVMGRQCCNVERNSKSAFLPADFPQRCEDNMMTKEEAWKWADEITIGGYGSGDARAEYRQNYPIGKMAEGVWDDGLFTYGIEYGILIAVAKIFGPDSPK